MAEQQQDGGDPSRTARVSPAQQRAALFAAILASTIVSVDATVVNVALPAISDDLGGGLAGQQWVANGYLLTLAALILISGSLADLFGERRIFALGVAGFGVTSVLCAIAPSIEALVAARTLQGVSGALLTPAALAIIVAVFPADERGKAIGTWTAFGGIGILIGPLVGGQIVDSISWRWVFALQVPLVAGALVLAVTAVPEGAGRQAGTRIDYLGAVLCAAGLAGISFALIQQPVSGWGSPRIYGPLLAGAMTFAAFIVYELRARAPMLPLELFTRRNFAVGNVQTLMMYGGLAILTFFLTLFLQQVAGYSALEAGTVMLVPTGFMFVLARRFGAMADRSGPKLFMSLGPAISALGFFLLMRLDETVSFTTDLLPALLLFSLGLSMTVPVLTAAVLADADEHNAGIASATNNAIARTAALLATAAIGSVVAGSFGGVLDERLGDRALPAEARAAVEDAKRRSLGRLDLAAVPAAERQSVAEANADASVSAFRLSAGIGGGLLLAAALIGAAGLRNPRRDVRAQECPGGTVVGHPRDVARPPSAGIGRVPGAPVGAASN